MTYGQVLQGLLAEGNVVAPRPEPIDAASLRMIEHVLTEFDRHYRWQLPAGIPEFDVKAGRWAAVNFMRACQCAVYPDIGDEQFPRLFVPDLDGKDRGQSTQAAAHDPATHYSVDLVFRFLPGLVKFAMARAEADPLVQRLLDWCRAWPLSSVGVELGEPVRIDGFVENPGLRRMYADRIIESGDKSRLSDPRALRAVESSWGMFPQLGGRIGSAIQDIRRVELQPANTDETSANQTNK